MSGASETKIIRESAGSGSPCKSSGVARTAVSSRPTSGLTACTTSEATGRAVGDFARLCLAFAEKSIGVMWSTVQEITASGCVAPVPARIRNFSCSGLQGIEGMAEGTAPAWGRRRGEQ